MFCKCFYLNLHVTTVLQITAKSITKRLLQAWSLLIRDRFFASKFCVFLMHNICAPLHNTTSCMPPNYVCCIAPSPVTVGVKLHIGHTQYMHEKLTKCPNFTWFLPEKYIFPEFGGWGPAPRLLRLCVTPQTLKMYIQCHTAVGVLAR